MISANEKVGRRFLMAGKDVQREVVAHITFRENSWLIEYPDGGGRIVATSILSGRIPAIKEIKTMVDELFAPYGASLCALLAGAILVEIQTLLDEPIPPELDV